MIYREIAGYLVIIHRNLVTLLTQKEATVVHIQQGNRLWSQNTDTTGSCEM